MIDNASRPMLDAGMTDIAPAVLHAPIFFERNRVFRVYRGGRLFHEFFGDPDEDGSFPEEWIASTVAAQNGEKRGAYEGVSLVRGLHLPFSSLMESHPMELLGGRTTFELLVKILHSAIRLPVQTHPDKGFARRHFASEHGKTEMWLVLAAEAVHASISDSGMGCAGRISSPASGRARRKKPLPPGS